VHLAGSWLRSKVYNARNCKPAFASRQGAFFCDKAIFWEEIYCVELRCASVASSAGWRIRNNEQETVIACLPWVIKAIAVKLRIQKKQMFL
jgi:hypothetical protein